MDYEIYGRSIWRLPISHVIHSTDFRAFILLNIGKFTLWQTLQNIKYRHEFSCCYAICFFFYFCLCAPRYCCHVRCRFLLFPFFCFIPYFSNLVNALNRRRFSIQCVRWLFSSSSFCFVSANSIWLNDGWNLNCVCFWIYCSSKMCVCVCAGVPLIQ